MLIFGAGLWLGVERGRDPQMQPAATTIASPSTGLRAGAPAESPVRAVSSEDLAALERRLRGEMAQIRVAANTSAPVSASDGQMLARVRQLVEESEQRQQRELAIRMTQVMRDFDTQRRMDLAQIQGNFSQIEGATGAQVREQRDMLNYLMRVSQQGK